MRSRHNPELSLSSNELLLRPPLAAPFFPLPGTLSSCALQACLWVTRASCPKRKILCYSQMSSRVLATLSLKLTERRLV